MSTDLRLRLMPLRNRFALILGMAVTFQVLLPQRQAQAAADCPIPHGDILCDIGNGIAEGTQSQIKPFVDAAQGTGEAVDFATDPLGYIADGIRDAVASLLQYLAELLIGSTTQIDWTNGGFIRTYTMAFAASTVLTLVYWLIAVAKRAAQGMPPVQALSESVGFLLMAFLVSAFAPGIVFWVVQLFDQAAEAMFQPVAGDIADMMVVLLASLGALMALPGGPIIVGFIGLFLVSLIFGVWCELIIRNALILTGLVFGPTVFAGLVDRALWDHTKRWISAMVAVTASKYVTLTTLALGTGLISHTDGFSALGRAISTVLTAIAIFCISLYLPFTIYKFIPAFGDDIQSMYQARDDFQGRARGLADAGGDAFDVLKERLSASGPEDADAESAGSSSSAGSEDPDSGPDAGGPLPGGGDEDGEEGPEDLAAAGGPAGAGVDAAKKAEGEVEDRTTEAARNGAERASGGGGESRGSPSGGGGTSGGPSGGPPSAPASPPGEPPAPSSPRPDSTTSEPAWPPPEQN